MSEENYCLAVRNAARRKGGKKRKNRRAGYYKENMERLKPSILAYAANFKNAGHVPKTINDGIGRKARKIVVPNMDEQVVHHMIINVMQPIFMKGMYEHSYGSIPGRGALKGRKNRKRKGRKRKKKNTKSGQEAIEKWIRRDPKNMKYCLKMGIRKYFDSVPHCILKQKLAKLIRDKAFLDILYEVVDAVPGGRGIPIGFYTSQWFANWYLTELDHYIKEELRARHYIRYMDDMVIFGGNKRELHRIRAKIGGYLNNKLGLELKDDWQVFLFDYVKSNGDHIGRDLDFMGLRFFRDRTILRKSVMIKAARKAKKHKKNNTVHSCRQILSYLGWIDCTGTYRMYETRIKPYVNFREAKQKISRYQRRQNNVEKSTEQQPG